MTASTSAMMLANITSLGRITIEDKSFMFETLAIGVPLTKKLRSKNIIAYETVPYTNDFIKSNVLSRFLLIHFSSIDAHKSPGKNINAILIKATSIDMTYAPSCHAFVRHQAHVMPPRFPPAPDNRRRTPGPPGCRLRRAGDGRPRSALHHPPRPAGAG